MGTPLKDWDVQIYRGILTGYNEAFIIDQKTKNRLIEASPKSAEIIRPILRGRDIHKYYCDSSNQWIIFIPWHFPLHEDEMIKGTSLLAEQTFQAEYPVIYNYLLSHKHSLENRNKAETGIRYEWYALQRFGANYWKEFEKTKIVWGNLSLRGAYSLAGKGVYINAPSVFIPTENLYLLAMLNSKIADFYIKQLGVTRNGGYFEYKPMFVEQLPIPIISKEQEGKFSILVARRKKYKDNTDISEIDSQLDNMACDLFGLTAEEKEFLYNVVDSMKGITSELNGE
jgi:hypothetical protein